MDHHPTHEPLTPRQQILKAVHHLEHLVPGQAPLNDFVHHNTLHGFQHLPFPQALASARSYNGIYGYLSAERFRALLQEGRIRPDDLNTVIAACPELNPQQLIGPFQRGEVIRLLLEHPITPLTASQLAWEINEKSALTKLQPNVCQTSRARLLKTGPEATVVAELWQTCLELFGLKRSGWYQEDRLDLAAEQADEFYSDHSEVTSHAAELRTIQQIRQEADRLIKELLDSTGHTRTLRGLLLATTGQDLLEAQRPYLLRILAAFLDQGLANWPLPNRQQGFYRAWRRCARTEAAFALEELPDWPEFLADLPETAMEAIEESLSIMGLPVERWDGYLERLALELPGWSGMIQWRSAKPDYQGLRASVQVTMLDYLAVRLVLERLFAIRLCRTLWLVEPTLETLIWHFRHHRGEFMARWALFNHELPEHLTTQASRLLTSPHNEPNLGLEWRKLAFKIWNLRQNSGKKPVAAHGARNKAWPLFLLAQHLGLAGQELHQLGTPFAEALLACALNDEQSGHLWLQAYERRYREQIFAALTANHGRGRWAKRETRPSAQVIFCMDDREEGIRRHLEERVPSIETLGAAGFFGVPINWLGLDDREPSALCPVVVTPSHTIEELPIPGHEAQHAHHRLRRDLRSRFKQLLFRASHQGVVVPFLLALLAAPLALITLMGKTLFPLTMGRLSAQWRDQFDGSVATTVTLNAPEDHRTPTPALPRLGFTDREQAERVEGFLRTIGLTYGFAPLVAILGHGSSSQNNPHLAAYDCGACSGRHGGPNARLFAAMANRPEVRAQLQERGITIPNDTWFIGGEHNTGNESITWLDQAILPASAQADLTTLTAALNTARAGSAHERARRLASAPRRPTPERALSHMVGRGVDFSQARPELGHATNAVALIGRRSVAQGVFFDRRMFLISYDPTQDQEGKIVESILLAAGPVGAGISLEYYFSTVNNDRFGCGTKVVHNITGLMGVMEGSSSDLRTGLPQQMIEIHEAMRLLVVVEQRPEILTAIYHRQPEIQQLVGNAWIHLAVIDPDCGAIQLFQPGIGWVAWKNTEPAVPMVPNSTTWYDGHSGPLPPALLAQEAP